MGRKRVPGWPGYVHRQANGRDLFIIERQIKGRKFHVSTRASTISAALVQLERFERAPAEYDPGVSLNGEGALLMRRQLALDYFDYLVSPRSKGGKGNYRKHSKQMANRMKEWAADLAGRDLKSLDLGRDIIPVLERRTNRKNRIIALKGFYTWLRTKKHLLKSAHDPTLDLPVPQSSPEKHRRRKVVPFESAFKAAEKLDLRMRDALNLLIATGWHITEAERFVREEESEIILNPPGVKVLAALVMRHKSGDTTSTPLTRVDQLESAQRLKEAETFPSRLNSRLKTACIAAKVDAFTFGVLRHSVATWAVEQGATVPEVALFLHHKSPETTRRFYVDTATPVPAVPVRSLLRVVR